MRCASEWEGDAPARATRKVTMRIALIAPPIAGCGRSATSESERGRHDRRRSQFDPLQSIDSAHCRHWSTRERTFNWQIPVSAGGRQATDASALTLVKHPHPAGYRGLAAPHRSGQIKTSVLLAMTRRAVRFPDPFLGPRELTRAALAVVIGRTRQTVALLRQVCRILTRRQRSSCDRAYRRDPGLRPCPSGNNRPATDGCRHRS